MSIIIAGGSPAPVAVAQIAALDAHLNSWTLGRFDMFMLASYVLANETPLQQVQLSFARRLQEFD